jgi:hypothetical protein
MPCVYEFRPGADMSVPETQSDQGFANRALPVMYLSTANSGISFLSQPARPFRRLTGSGNLLMRTADKFDQALYASAILWLCVTR